jgi:hypothetical protein
MATEHGQASLMITFKNGEHVWYEISPEDLDHLTQNYAEYLTNNSFEVRAYDVATRDKEKRKLVLDFREVRFIG